jgi:hypothetical protein
MKISPAGQYSSCGKNNEDIAMHFNDLILKLRTAALGAVAALSTLVALLQNPIPSTLALPVKSPFAFLLALYFSG